MSPPATAAFEVYRDLGRRRTLSDAARLLKKSESLLRGWSSKHGWQRLIAEHDHAHLKEGLGQREIDREHGTQRMVEWIDEAAETLHEIMIDKGLLPILDRQGNHATDANKNKLYRPMVKASTRMEAAKAILGIAGLVPVKRIETVDRSGEQLDAAANVLRAMTKRQVDRLIEDLDDTSD